MVCMVKYRMNIKVCLHNHTYKSKNAINTLEDFENAINSEKIDKVAITDHDYIHEALVIQKKLGEEKIIVGQEITTKEGEIIALFIKKFIPTGLTAKRVCELIHSQGGIVYLPHILSPKGLQEETLEEIKPFIHVVEGYNGWRHRSLAKPFLSEKVNEKAQEWAKDNNIPFVSSSDAHYPANIGRCYTTMEDFSDSESFLKSLKGDLNLTKRKNVVNLQSVRTWVKGRFGRDLLSFLG